MDMQAILDFGRDVIVVGYMFVLRIGVPLLIVLMVGWWLRRLLEEKEEKPALLAAQDSHPTQSSEGQLL